MTRRFSKLELHGEEERKREEGGGGREESRRLLCCWIHTNSQDGGEEDKEVREMEMGRDTEDTHQLTRVRLRPSSNEE